MAYVQSTQNNSYKIKRNRWDSWQPVPSSRDQSKQTEPSTTWWDAMGGRGVAPAMFLARRYNLNLTIRKYKTKLRHIPQNKWPVFFRSVEVVRVKERLRNDESSKNPIKLGAMHDVWLNPLPAGEIMGRLEKRVWAGGAEGGGVLVPTSWSEVTQETVAACGKDTGKYSGVTGHQVTYSQRFRKKRPYCVYNFFSKFRVASKNFKGRMLHWLTTMPKVFALTTISLTTLLGHLSPSPHPQSPHIPF